jgi:hypothetical protein
MGFLLPLLPVNSFGCSRVFSAKPGKRGFGKGEAK